MNNSVNKYNIGVISLGCDKNRVDTEKMLYRIKHFGHNIVNDTALCDVVIINTCAFLQSSRRESVETILSESARGGGRKIIVTGCLPQKHIDEIYDTLKEADGFLGTADYNLINHAIETVMSGKRFNGVNAISVDTYAETNGIKTKAGTDSESDGIKTIGTAHSESDGIKTVGTAHGESGSNKTVGTAHSEIDGIKTEATAHGNKSVESEYTVSSDTDGIGRVLTTDAHYAFLMIADGCNNRCSYCLIPQIRGRYKSVRSESVIAEATQLLQSGVKEFILVAQDVTRYGIDIYGKYSITGLIKKLSAIEGMPDNSIRLMYCYPERISDELITEIAENPKVIKYIDMPLQHVNDRILRDMKRQSTYQKICALINKLREKVPGVSIRSTFIVGFPGETEQEFAQLCGFLQEYKLDNVGFFAYSKEKGTDAYSLPDQIPAAVKKARLKQVNLLQQRIYREENLRQVGSTLDVICDGYDAGRQMYYGRTFKNAPLSDKLVYFTADAGLISGNIYPVYISDSDEYDLYGAV